MNPEEIARTLERSQQAATLEIAAESELVADGCMGFEGPGSFMNRACGIGVDGPVTGADLDRVVAFFTSRGAEPRVEVSAYADETLLPGLAERGFVLREMVHVFARELPRGEDFDALVAQRPAGLEISRLDPNDAAAARAFVVLAESGFVPEGASVPEASITASLKALQRPGVAAFVARIDGVVAGAASSGTRDSGTALFGTTVLAPFRRRGVQQALIAARLAHARAVGSAFASVGSRPGIGTERNALRLGFRLIYSRVILVKPGPGLSPSA